MKKEKEVPTVKCAVLAFCFSILALMSSCAAAPAEASGKPVEQMMAIEETAEMEEADVPDAERTAATPARSGAKAPFPSRWMPPAPGR